MFCKKCDRDFNRLHGRPVMKQEDIQPVAHEYQRYKVGVKLFVVAVVLSRWFICRS